MQEQKNYKSPSTVLQHLAKNFKLSYKLYDALALITASTVFCATDEMSCQISVHRPLLHNFTDCPQQRSYHNILSAVLPHLSPNTWLKVTNSCNTTLFYSKTSGLTDYWRSHLKQADVKYSSWTFIRPTGNLVPPCLLKFCYNTLWLAKRVHQESKGS